MGNVVVAHEKQKIDTTWNNWNYRISPYFWYVGFRGTIYKPPVPTLAPIPPPPKYEIDVGFKDIKNSIKFALMLAGQYRNGHFVAQFNSASLILESEAITPWELVLQNNIIKLNYSSGDLGIGYRIIKHPKFEFDALAVAKFIYFKIGLSTKLGGSIPIEGQRANFWMDPAVGTNIKYIPHRKIEFYAYGDIGSTLLNNSLSYQFIGTANYLFTKTFHISLGYRWYTLEFPKDEAIFNGKVNGWLMKIGFQF